MNKYETLVSNDNFHYYITTVGQLYVWGKTIETTFNIPYWFEKIKHMRRSHVYVNRHR